VRNTGTSWRSASHASPPGTLSSSTMMVIKLAITPSLNASRRASAAAQRPARGPRSAAMARARFFQAAASAFRIRAASARTWRSAIVSTVSIC